LNPQVQYQFKNHKWNV